MKHFIFIALVFSFVKSQAQLDGPSKEALEKTQEVLLNAEKRSEAQKNDPKAQSMDKSIESLAGDYQKKEKIYDISAKVFSDLAQKTNGDAKEMERIIEEAQKDPEAFYNKMFPEAQKQELRGLANEIEKTKAPQAPAQN
jgi:hypothetical protein